MGITLFAASLSVCPVVALFGSNNLLVFTLHFLKATTGDICFPRAADDMISIDEAEMLIEYNSIEDFDHVDAL